MISALHVDGYVDALRLRVTLSGFALGTFLDGVALPHPAAAPVVWSARAA